MLPEINKVRALSKSGFLSKVSREWMQKVGSEYTYQFEWLGLPIIQYPTDILAIQEAIYKIKPDFIIETGIARGGSVLLSSSILALLDLEESHASSKVFTPRRKLFAIDIDIREHAIKGLESSFLKSWINLIQGDSTDPKIASQIGLEFQNNSVGFVILDSNHTHNHVLNELRLYSRFISVGSYFVVLDTEIEFAPAELFKNRTWGKGNSPHSAIKQFLRENSDFEVDEELSTKLGITTAPDGFLKRVK
jgi:cephalosporin hydroxylase